MAAGIRLRISAQHSFPHDWRSGPHIWNWDPSKWIILLLNRLGLVTGLRSVREQDLKEAMEYMHFKGTHGVPPAVDGMTLTGETWQLTQAYDYVKSKPGSCVVVIEDYFFDLTPYLGEHVRPHLPDLRAN